MGESCDFTSRSVANWNHPHPSPLPSRERGLDASPARPFDWAQDERPHPARWIHASAHLQPALGGRNDGWVRSLGG